MATNDVTAPPEQAPAEPPDATAAPETPDGERDPKLYGFFVDDGALVRCHVSTKQPEVWFADAGEWHPSEYVNMQTGASRITVETATEMIGDGDLYGPVVRTPTGEGETPPEETLAPEPAAQPAPAAPAA
jgi:hypothetical protein